VKHALFLLMGAAAGPLAAQFPGAGGANTTLRSGALYEGYSFGPGLAFRSVHEVTIPVAAVQRFGDRLTVDVSAAFASASVKTTSGSTLDLSGFTDTDIRASYGAIPGRLLVTVVGTVPTGKAQVADSLLPLFGVLATDVLDFTTPSFGGGGGVTGGASSAFKLGDNWALGAAASFHYAASFIPVVGQGALTPGSDIRLRLGVEGPFGGGKYLRGALVYMLSGRDTLSGQSAAFTGDRLLLYGTLSLPVGRSNLSFYGFNLLRLKARGVPTTATGAVRVPRGDVFTLGARLDRPLTPVLTLAPHGDTTFAQLGLLLRPGADLRWRVGNQTALVFQGLLTFGTLHDQGAAISTTGPKLAAYVEWNR
jgi:hypothetical protein